VLVVEDDVLMRVGAAQYLRDCGFTVLEAANADEAQTIIADDRFIRAVFADVRLPGRHDGMDLMTWIRAEHPEVRVLLTTGLHPLPVPPAGVPLIRKPYYLFEVERHIKSMLAEKPGAQR
jgi:DNA-binding NtrC family response regulator